MRINIFEHLLGISFSFCLSWSSFFLSSSASLANISIWSACLEFYYNFLNSDFKNSKFLAKEKLRHRPRCGICSRRRLLRSGVFGHLMCRRRRRLILRCARLKKLISDKNFDSKNVGLKIQSFLTRTPKIEFRISTFDYDLKVSKPELGNRKLKIRTPPALTWSLIHSNGPKNRPVSGSGRNSPEKLDRYQIIGLLLINYVHKWQFSLKSPFRGQYLVDFQPLLSGVQEYLK